MLLKEDFVLIHYLDLNKFNQQILYKFLDQLSENDKKKNRKYLRDINKLQHLAGRWLLYKGMEKWEINPDIIKEIVIDSNERPYLKNTPLNFNISHSKTMVVCAMSKHQLGIDVEFIDSSIDFKYFEQTMNARQWSYIKTSNKPYVEFYKHWAIKESVIKANGKGFAIPVKDIEIMRDIALLGNETWFIHEAFLKHEFVCYTSLQYRVNKEQYCITQF